jgi:hypothetical protein
MDLSRTTGAIPPRELLNANGEFFFFLKVTGGMNYPHLNIHSTDAGQAGR